MKKKIRNIIFTIFAYVNFLYFIRLIATEDFTPFKPLLMYGYVTFIAMSLPLIVMHKFLKVEGKVVLIFKGLLILVTAQLFIISIITIGKITLFFSLMMVIILVYDFYKALSNNKQKILPPV
ncbi:MAG: hypothetical protein RR588_01775 [Solibacillus sp.]